jgi:hypothetical protein
MSDPAASPRPESATEQARDPMIEGLVRSIHPEKVFEYLPGMTTPNLASLYGLDQPTYRAYRDGFAAQVDRAADELLAEDDTAAAHESLPFADDSTVAVVGESSTDAADSWWEILTTLCVGNSPAAPSPSSTPRSPGTPPRCANAPSPGRWRGIARTG